MCEVKWNEESCIWRVSLLKNLFYLSRCSLRHDRVLVSQPLRFVSPSLFRRRFSFFILLFFLCLGFSSSGVGCWTLSLSRWGHLFEVSTLTQSTTPPAAALILMGSVVQRRFFLDLSQPTWPFFYPPTPSICQREHHFAESVNRNFSFNCFFPLLVLPQTPQSVQCRFVSMWKDKRGSLDAVIGTQHIYVTHIFLTCCCCGALAWGFTWRFNSFSSCRRWMKRSRWLFWSQHIRQVHLTATVIHKTI